MTALHHKGHINYDGHDAYFEAKPNDCDQLLNPPDQLVGSSHLQLRSQQHLRSGQLRQSDQPRQADQLRQPDQLIQPDQLRQSDQLRHSDQLMHSGNQAIIYEDPPKESIDQSIASSVHSTISSTVQSQSKQSEATLNSSQSPTNIEPTQPDRRRRG